MLTLLWHLHSKPIQATTSTTTLISSLQSTGKLLGILLLLVGNIAVISSTDTTTTTTTKAKAFATRLLLSTNKARTTTTTTEMIKGTTTKMLHKHTRRFVQRYSSSSVLLSSSSSLSLSTNNKQSNDNVQKNNNIAFVDRTITNNYDYYTTMKRGYTKSSKVQLSSSLSFKQQKQEDQQEILHPSTNFNLAKRLDGLDSPTVWQEFSPLSVQYQSINLGQGFPDWEPPNFVKQCMYESIYIDNTNQYARSYAHLPLATTLASEYTTRWSKQFPNSENTPIIDPTTMVATAVGCTNVLYCALHGLLNHGDEVILFEPSFDIYSSQVCMAGGTPVFVPFRDPNSGSTSDNTLNDSSSTNKLQYANDKFTIDFNELEAAITSKTKVLLINTPHNPTGKMFTLYELQKISSILEKYPQIIVISDEVYEHIVFTETNDKDGTTSTVEHISIASLPNMFDKTLTLSSSGKTFSCTGWKVGWAIGPEYLIKAVSAVQQWVNFSAPTPNQHAIAKALQIARQPYTVENDITYNTYYDWLSADYQRKRQLLIDALQSAGMRPIIPHGGFFIMADTSTINFPYTEQYKYQITDAMPKLIESSDNNNNQSTIIMPRDWALSRFLTENVGVTAIPPSAFYCLDRVPLAKNYLRFAFCKSDATIIEAHKRFESYFTTTSPPTKKQ